MTVSKETMKKVKRLEKLREEAQRIYEELCVEFHDYMDGVCINDFHIFNEPYGDEQDEGRILFAKHIRLFFGQRLRNLLLSDRRFQEISWHFV